MAEYRADTVVSMSVDFYLEAESAEEAAEKARRVVLDLDLSPDEMPDEIDAVGYSIENIEVTVGEA
jgi:hypothetical protein